MEKIQAFKVVLFVFHFKQLYKKYKCLINEEAFFKKTFMIFFLLRRSLPYSNKINVYQHSCTLDERNYIRRIIKISQIIY